MIGVETCEVKFDGKDEVDEADEEAVGVERRLEEDEDDKGWLMKCDGFKQRCGSDGKDEQLRKAGHC